MSRRTTPNPPLPPNPSADKLNAWLKKQAAKLKSLEVKGNRLKLDFVQLAKEKGEILLEAEKRASKIPARFDVWVVQDALIGMSTARLYMDVAKNYDDVKERFANSNPLELTLRNFRDAIRDARQGRGEGKPGSGKRKITDDATSPTDEGGGEAATETEEAHPADAGNENDAAAVTDKKFDKLMSRAQPGGDMHNGGDTPKATPTNSFVEGSQTTLENMRRPNIQTPSAVPSPCAFRISISRRANRYSASMQQEVKKYKAISPRTCVTLFLMVSFLRLIYRLRYTVWIRGPAFQGCIKTPGQDRSGSVQGFCHVHIAGSSTS